MKNNTIYIKNIIISLIVVMIVISTSTTIPAINESRHLENKIIFIDEMVDEISENEKEFTNLIHNFEFNNKNNNQNTEDYYRYSLLFLLFKILTLDMDYQNWLKLGAVVNFIGVVDIILVFILLSVGALEVDTAILIGLLTGLIPISYSDIVFRMGSWLTGRAIDMAFYITDPLGEPVDGLEITAEPLDNKYNYPIFEAKQKDTVNYSGWYYIPSMHSAPMVDVPPGIHTIKINWESEECSSQFETQPIPIGNRYSENRTFARNHPYIMRTYPIDNGNGISLNPIFEIEIKDFQDDTLESIIVSEFTDGNWEQIRILENEKSGVYTAKSIYANEFNKEYKWRIEVIDNKGYFYEEICTFFTSSPPSNHLPEISNEVPENNAENIPIYTTQLKVFIYDEDGDLLDWSIKSDPDIGSISMTEDVNGLKTCEIYDLEYSTTYQWTVTVNDGNSDNMISKFSFTTQSRS
jgi:hypothetical protein